jgi:threonine dehydrogenase-like Zn-dependent dehydrogenase
MEIPKPGPGQVLLKIGAAAICGSDLHGYRRKLEPDSSILRFVPGHEPCGQILELGPDVGSWKPGDRVVVYHRMTCMECYYCRSGARNLCLDRKGAYGFNVPGADEEYMVANAHDCLRLPDDFSYVDGALFACQVGTAYDPLKVLGVSGRDNVVVSGLGPVGLFAVQLGKAMGATIVGVDPSPQRRHLAESLGADAVLDPTAGQIEQQVDELCPGGADKLVETSGAMAAHAVIAKCLRNEGEAAIVGMGTPGPALNLGEVLWKSIRIYGSNLYPDREFDEIIEFVRQKRVPIDKVVTHELSIEDGPAAFRLADGATSGKVVFRFD